MEVIVPPDPKVLNHVILKLEENMKRMGITVEDDKNIAPSIIEVEVKHVHNEVLVKYDQALIEEKEIDTFGSAYDISRDSDS